VEFYIRVFYRKFQVSLKSETNDAYFNNNNNNNNYNWVITRWQWLFYMYTNMKKKSN